MPTFISPHGNPEVWETRPNGYWTPEEWRAKHPPEPPTPSSHREVRRELIRARLDALDRFALRPMASILAGAGDTEDEIILEAIEREKRELRAEGAALEGGETNGEDITRPPVAEDLPYRLTANTYHRSSCGYGKDGEAATEAEALASGKKACTRCIA